MELLILICTVILNIFSYSLANTVKLVISSSVCSKHTALYVVRVR